MVCMGLTTLLACKPGRSSERGLLALGNLEARALGTGHAVKVQGFLRCICDLPCGGKDGAVRGMETFGPLGDFHGGAETRRPSRKQMRR